MEKEPSGSRPAHFYRWKAISNADIYEGWVALFQSAVSDIALFYAISEHREDYI